MLQLLKEHTRLLGFGILLTFFSGFGQTFLIALYVPAIGEEFGFSDSLLGSYYAGITLLSALCLPFLGKLIDRYYIKYYSIAVLILFAASLIFTAYAVYPAMLFIGVWGIRLAGQGLMSHTALTSMARYFHDARGKAISMAAIGHPLGQAILPIIIALSISSIGWRYTLLCSAGLSLIILVPYVLKFTHFPQGSGKINDQNDGQKKQVVWTQKQIFRSKPFWIIAPNFFLLPLVSTGLFFYQLSLASFKGWQAEWIALCFMFYAVASFLSMLISGILVDKWKAINLFPYYFIPYAAGLFILATSNQPWIVPVYLTLLGITSGFGSTIKSALQAELFGTLSLGAVRSLFTTIMVLSTAAGPAVFAYALESGFNFNELFLTCFATVILVMIHSFRIYSPYTRKKLYLKWKLRIQEKK